jgi:hypothetical protein
MAKKPDLVPLEHPEGRTEAAKHVFDQGHELAAQWNEEIHLGQKDWHTHGWMVHGVERCFLASHQGGHDIPEQEWHLPKKAMH